MSALKELLERVEKATGPDVRVCENCGAIIRKLRQHTKERHRARKFCSQSCNSQVTQRRRILSAHEMRAYLRSRADLNEAGCWVWRFSVTNQGYPSLTHNNERVKGHRLAYRTFVGPIPEGAHVLHRCDNRRCINPDHLRLGTNADNVLDRNSRGRQARGESSGSARITESDVRLIRSSGLTNRELGEMLGLARHTVCGIRNGRSWKHVQA